MRLKKLIEARRIIGGCAEYKLHPRIAYKFMKLMKETESEELFAIEKVNEIMQKYGERDKDNNLILKEGGVCIKEDATKLCEHEIAELENIEIEIPVQITLDDLEGLKLTMKEIYALDELIKED